MTRLFSVKTWGVFALAAVLVATLAVVAPRPAAAQATVSTGSIEGLITDPTGAAVPSAKVAITNKATGQKTTPVVTSTGTYNSGPLLAGDYTVRVEAPGFKTSEKPVSVELGVVSSGSVTLQVGPATTVVTVEETGVQVNTEQPTVQGVMNLQQIENLPINGRNFLDLAQLEPGVQIQDGGNFDPTKNGFMSISFGGRFGRTARIEVDGIDISDETVGTTTQNFPAIAIQEFQVAQSSLDVSTELTSSGTVNVTTQRGANAFHGETFFSGRSDQTAARLGPKQVDFARKQYGVRFGGPFRKDKLFFVGAWERTQQDLEAPVALSSPFQGLSGSFNSPFRDNQFFGRLDYTLKPGWLVFYRFSYEQNRNVTGFIPNTFQPFGNADNTPVHVAGLDFSKGRFSHSMRFGFTKFRNGIVDAVLGSSIFNPLPTIPVSIAIGADGLCITPGADVFCSGPNILAPQKTFQRNVQGKYDGSWTFRSHILRYGMSVNAIKGGGFASFVGLAPSVQSVFSATNQAIAAGGPFSGGATNPLNWPVTVVLLGNGQGCFTEIRAFDSPCGGQFDTRFQWYAGDSWKMRHNLTVSGGLRYVRDTGRTDADLPALAALNRFQPGLGNPVRQPNKNYGGTLGVAWDPTGAGKTVIRAGTGIYYENAVFNNVLFDRPGRLPTGLFNAVSGVCPASVCNMPIGSVAQTISNLQTAFQQATRQAGPASNSAFFNNALTAASRLTGAILFAPDYRSPYSFVVNFGIQRQLWAGTVVSADYVRNVNLHYLLFTDVNHDGDARFLDMAGALSAINATNASFGCTTQPTLLLRNDCAIAAGATIADYASRGLTSGSLGAPGGSPAGPGTVAFPGINPNFGQIQVLQPIGRSVYNAMQVKLRGQKNGALPYTAGFIKNMNYQVSYSLSRYEGQALDTDFINSATNFRNTSQFIGPNGLDRTHQLSAGAFLDLPLASRVSLITHWLSNLPANILLPPASSAADIFQLDVLGEGQTVLTTLGDPLPGTNLGDFGRGVRVADLNSLLSNYSNRSGNQLTPAGQALVNATPQLFSATQLQQLCAVTPSLNPSARCATAFPTLRLAPAPPGQVGLSSLFTFDLGMGWRLRPSKLWSNVRESVVIEPKITVYNLFNRQNFDGPNAPLSGILGSVCTTAPCPTGAINNTTRPDRTNRIGLGTGVFALGAPRQVEFGATITF